MLNDRDYMRDRRKNASPSPISGMKALFAIILVNVFFFMIPEKHLSLLALQPLSFQHGSYYQPLSAIFLHVSFYHIFFNMFSLYIFGSLSAPILGARRLIQLFLFSGVVGNLLWLVFYWGTQNVVVGASGAVMGVIIATAMLLPNVEMLLLFIPFPVKMRTLAMVFIAIDIFGQLSSSSTSNIAFLAHIGGFLAGFLYMILFMRREIAWNPIDSIFSAKGAPGPRVTQNTPRNENAGGPYYFRNAEGAYKETTPRDNPNSALDSSRPVSQKELDYLLDKISRLGINALSENELARLRQAREQMQNQ